MSSPTGSRCRGARSTAGCAICPSPARAREVLGRSRRAARAPERCSASTGWRGSGRYTEGLASFDALATDPTFRDFVALYIAEGYKRCRNTVAICNSDPAVMILAASWLSRLTRRRLKFCVQYHADQDPDALRRFWAQTLRVSPTGIVATRKSNSNRLSGRTWRCQHGVLTIRVCDTALRAKLEAWAARMRQSWH